MINLLTNALKSTSSLTLFQHVTWCHTQSINKEKVLYSMRWFEPVRGAATRIFWLLLSKQREAMVSLPDKPGQEKHLAAKLGFPKSFTLYQMRKAMSAHGIRLLREILVKTRILVCADMPDMWDAQEGFVGNTRVVWKEPKTKSYGTFLYPTCQQVPACPQNRTGFEYVLAHCLDRNGW